MSSKCLECCLNQEVGSNIVPGSVAMFFEGPQGSGKTTLATNIAELLNVPVRRGFPTGAEIVEAKGSQHVICQNAFNRIGLNISTRAVFDRSPLSQLAYMIRTGNPDEIGCLQDVLHQMSAGYSSVIIAYTEAPASVCLSRQDHTSPLKLKTLSEVEGEVATYQQLAAATQACQESNINILRLLNEDEAHKQQNLSNLLYTLSQQ